jgi:tetratricopeptide (TPR) repeat protein
MEDTMAEIDKCFVVMPFGIKPRNDGTDRTYNFDKVYRVIIQRAISNVKMQPLRADETEGNRIVHADMFKDLRDRPVVLVDLSMLNPNVMYELGIRHVMSSTGTVLMANEETVKRLPFDIALSRTISYRYDGEHLDWDEVERVVPQLQAAIEEARRGAPDSPVYAFLDQVLSPSTFNKDDTLIADSKNTSSELDAYQQKIAELWIAQQEIDLDKLFDEHGNSVFGSRAIGYYGLTGKVEKIVQSKIADFLFNHEQYDLAARLYEECNKSNILDFKDLLHYGSAVAYACPDLPSAQIGLRIIEKAREAAKRRVDNDPNDNVARKEYSTATHHVASMWSWIWNISHEENDLQKVITELRDAIRTSEELLNNGVTDISMSRYGQNLLRYTMFLRIAENDPERLDIEKNFQKILSLKPGNRMETSASYQRWYQVFVLADMGKYEDAQQRAQTAMALDIRHAMNKEESSVGRRQYSELRTMLETFSRYWRDPKSIARVSQIINSAHLS